MLERRRSGTMALRPDFPLKDAGAAMALGEAAGFVRLAWQRRPQHTAEHVGRVLGAARAGGSAQELVALLGQGASQAGRDGWPRVRAGFRWGVAVCWWS